MSVLYDVFTNKFSQDIFLQKYSMNQQETWRDTCLRVVESVCADKINSDVKCRLFSYMYSRKFIPGGRYLYSAGRGIHNIKNCFAFRAEDTREGWANLLFKVSSALLIGGGLGVDYSPIRPEGAPIVRTGGVCTGPISLMKMIDAVGEGIMQGGQRRSALYASLDWNHADISNFINAKRIDGQLRNTNVSVNFNDEFLSKITEGDEQATKIWKATGENAFKYADPGWSFNFNEQSSFTLRNACSEYISDTDSDSCNLGTIFLSRVGNKEELVDIIHCAMALLLCGQSYSDLPFPAAGDIVKENNRVGLGLGGIADWLIQRGYGPEVTSELHEWLAIYRDESVRAAHNWNTYLGLNPSKATRAIAPAGTIGILAESTTGIEPLFCKAYKRRFLKEGKWVNQYVVDGSVKRWMQMGIPVEQMWDSGDITFEQRVKFQADVQDYVDMGISSTCNLPRWGTVDNNEDNLQEKLDILLKYAPRLRGFTVYSDGCKGGQPLSRISLDLALGKEGVEFEDKEHLCSNGVCGL